MWLIKTLFRVSLIVFILFACGANSLYPQEGDQIIKDFYLSNYTKNKEGKWELRGKEAKIHNEYVDIDKMKGKYKTKTDAIKITSEKARLNKNNFDIFLKKNVEITNKDGIKLTTQSLNWQRNKDLVKTSDKVKINNKDMEIVAKGLEGESKLRKVNFNKDVKMKIANRKTKDVTNISCSGPLEIEYNEGTAVFNDNVVVEHKAGKLFADKATVYFNTTDKTIVKIICEGHVKIIRDDNVTFAEKATYIKDEERIILEGKPRLIYFPSSDKKLDFFN